jgi:hypothetical protein
MFYRIKNWAEYQHYKDRNPPWVKLHWNLLTSMDWLALDDASRVLAIACMLVASRNGGQIQADLVGLKYLERVAHLNSQPDLTPLIDCGFLASTTQAKSKRGDSPKKRREEIDKGDIPEGFKTFWETWPKSSRKGGRKPCLKKWVESDYEKDAAQIVAHVRAMKAGEQWREDKFIPAPMVYLNQARWDGAEPVLAAVRRLAI